jgi:lactate dehydrogenase-like 2-hydroxyacid dehydrogenase
MPPRVVVTRPFSDDALAPLRAAAAVDLYPEDRTIPADELAARLRDAEGLLCVPGDPVGEAAIEAGRRLRAIATVSVGFDHVDVAAARARGIALAHTPEVLTDSTAELAFALILAAARRLVEGDTLVRAGRWTGFGPGLFLGTELAGATLAIVGPGRIGGAVARRALAFGMRVLTVGTRRRADLEAAGCEAASLEQALAAADFVSLHVPLTPATRHMIGARELARMKPEAVLVNTSRGAVVDEAALVRALAAGRPGGAALDVFEHEPDVPAALRALPNVVLLPHLGSATRAARGRMLAAAVADLVTMLRGERPRFSIPG